MNSRSDNSSNGSPLSNMGCIRKARPQRNRNENNEFPENNADRLNEAMEPHRNCNDDNLEVKIPRTKYLKHNLQLTLEEMYTGVTRHLHVKRNVVCGMCQGSGSMDPVNKFYDTCDKCYGNGFCMVVRKTSPDVEEEMEQRCDLCWGEGKAIVPEMRCEQCGGSKTVPADLFLVVQVKPGTNGGQKIIYKGDGPQEPNKRPGDVIVTLEAVNHQTFVRRGDDLVMTMSLDLVESLCGFNKLVTTLDKRQLLIASPRGKVVKDKDVKYLVGEGMPKYSNPNERGDLYIMFRVNLPSSIRSVFAPAIEQCLQPRENVNIPMDAEERNMIVAKKKVINGRTIYVTIEEDFEPDQHYDQTHGAHEMNGQFKFEQFQNLGHDQPESEYYQQESEYYQQESEYYQQESEYYQQESEYCQPESEYYQQEHYQPQPEYYHDYQQEYETCGAFDDQQYHRK